MKIQDYFFSFLLLVFTNYSCKVVLVPEEKYAESKRVHAPFDAIIVPGMPYKDGKWPVLLIERIHWAKFIWDQKMTRNIIFSGGAVYTKYLECKIMKLAAIEMGIPEEHIYMDSLAQHSTENVFYSTKVAKDNGFKKVALATDVYQGGSLLRFLKKMQRRTGYDIQLLPIINDSLPKDPEHPKSINFNQAIGTNFIDIENTQSTWYRLRGTRGKHIDWRSF